MTTPVVPVAISLFGASLGSSPAMPATAISSATVIGADALTAPSGAAAPAPFADLVTEAVGQVQQLEQQSKAVIEGLMSGRGVDVHEAMIATQKAAMGFELVLAVRNKALTAYQQVMGMQF